MDKHGQTNPSLAMRLALNGIRKRFSSVPQLSTEELFNLFYSQESQSEEKKLLLLDVRSQEEFNISRIQNSIFVDFDKAEQENFSRVKNTIADRLSGNGCLYVVAYCALGYRSCSTINMLLSNYHSETMSGQLKLFNLEGSIFKWANEGKPVVADNNQPTNYVHPYNVVWGKLLNEKLRKWS